MFGLSWGQIAIIVLVGVFVLGPERIPTAVTWVMSMLRKARTMAAGAQEELRREIGPELDELRRQVADLQSLKELQDLRDLRDLHPKRLIGKNILGDEFSGGVSGFLGLKDVKESAPGPGAVTPVLPDTAQVAAPAASTANGSAPSLTKATPTSGTGSAATAMAAASSTMVTNGATRPAAPPSTATLAAPKVVGSAPKRTAVPAPISGERPQFDPDGT